MPSSRGSSNTGIEPTSLTSPAFTDRFFTTSTTWEAQKKILVPLPTLLGVGTLKARIPKVAHGITYLHLGVHSFPFPDPVFEEETQAFVQHSVLTQHQYSTVMRSLYKHAAEATLFLSLSLLEWDLVCPGLQGKLTL